MSEEWRPVAGYEGTYEVSSEGRIRSLPRKVYRKSGTWLTVVGAIKSQYLHPTRGYLTVSLSLDGRAVTKDVHRLVAIAFHGPPPGSGYQVCHDDGDRLNNTASNLRWGTCADNQRDAMRHGTHPYASRTHCSRGHEYDEANTLLRDGGRFRICRACRRIHDADRRARERARVVG